ncbi:MAG: TetR/AcrR family transcriptional regulator [Mycobacteriales bacterium]
MSGSATRARILRDVAQVFNTRGYAGTSMAAVLQATGLQKGGLYNHFGSKEQLAVAAFDYQIARIAERFESALDGVVGSIERLHAIVSVIGHLASDREFQGGCPVLNVATESDDGLPALREVAQHAMTSWQRLIGATVKQGVADGELRPGTDPRTVATVVTATLEGAVMLTKLYGDVRHMERAVEHVGGYIESLTAPRRGRRKVTG